MAALTVSSAKLFVRFFTDGDPEDYSTLIPLTQKVETISSELFANLAHTVPYKLAWNGRELDTGRTWLDNNVAVTPSLADGNGMVFVIATKADAGEPGTVLFPALAARLSTLD